MTTPDAAERNGGDRPPSPVSADRSSRHRDGESSDRRVRDDDRRSRRDSRKRSRSRSRSPSKSSRHSSTRHSRHGHRHRHRRHRSRSSSRRSRKRSRTPEDDPYAGLSKEEKELERSRRTVFVYNLAAGVDETALGDLFKPVGAVRDVRLIVDRFTGRSKGFGYIEYVDLNSVPEAMQLNGANLAGQSIIVKSSETEKIAAALHAPSGVGATFGTGGSGKSSSLTQKACRRVFVGNLDARLRERHIAPLFEEFGPVDFIAIQPEHVRLRLARTFGGEMVASDPENPMVKFQCAIVQFKYVEHARRAIEYLHKAKINDQTLGIGMIHDRFTLMDIDPTGRVLTFQGRQQFSSAAVPVFGGSLPPPPTSSSALIPSPCIVIHGMLTPDLREALDAGDADVECDLFEDVEGTCLSHGEIWHMDLNPRSGDLYVRFENMEAAMQVLPMLHHRWYNNKVVTCDFVPVKRYVERYPESGPVEEEKEEEREREGEREGDEETEGKAEESKEGENDAAEEKEGEGNGDGEKGDEPAES